MGSSMRMTRLALACAAVVVVALSAPVIDMHTRPQMSGNVTDAPSGLYEGGVPFIIDVQMTFSGSTVDADINVKVAHQEIKCPGEPTAISGSTISFPNITKTGDCMGDALRGQKKDVTKYSIT